jgi:DNA transposition AAA+ family ATPase
MAGHHKGTFIVTKERRRFAEFVNAVRKHRYIGIGFGPAGVGKTVFAKRDCPACRQGSQT